MNLKKTGLALIQVDAIWGRKKLYIEALGCDLGIQSKEHSCVLTELKSKNDSSEMVALWEEPSIGFQRSRVFILTQPLASHWILVFLL